MVTGLACGADPMGAVGGGLFGTEGDEGPTPSADAGTLDGADDPDPVDTSDATGSDWTPVDEDTGTDPEGTSTGQEPGSTGAAGSTTDGMGPDTTTGASPGDCCRPHGAPGCLDADVEACVCESDAYCCDEMWDMLCVQHVHNACGGCDPDDDAGPGTGDVETDEIDSGGVVGGTGDGSIGTSGDPGDTSDPAGATNGNPNGQGNG